MSDRPNFTELCGTPQTLSAKFARDEAGGRPSTRNFLAICGF
jgi:hypothetical protein